MPSIVLATEREADRTEDLTFLLKKHPLLREKQDWSGKCLQGSTLGLALQVGNNMVGSRE